MKLTFRAEVCTGCHICEMACTAGHEGAFNPARARLRINSEYDLTGLETKGNVCDLCGVCIEVCPSKAISLDEGRLFLDEEACTGCGICCVECPQGVIREREDGKVSLCDLCDGQPRCVEWCPREAVALEVG
ncbi:MAG: 4Fe-4S binding protein [Actinobacteria bacterium]|nr:4Fe-4S binding protein [Actinomycetota bacterium]